MKRVRIGDIHSMKNAPHFLATQQFFKYILDDPELNDEEVILVFLGDVVHYSIAEPSVISLWRWFFKQFKGEVEIMSGNHDDSSTTGENYLDIFEHEDPSRIRIFRKPTEVEQDNMKILYLPFYRQTSFPELGHREDYYPTLEGEYDAILLHDEIQPVFSKGIKLSENLKGVRRSGHIHTGSPCGTYLPSVNPTSTTEKDITTYIEMVDCETKEVTKREIPRFLNYRKFSYPEEIAIPEDNLVYLIDVYDAISRKDTLEYYKDIFSRENVFLHRTYRKSFIQDKEAEIYRKSAVQTKSHTEYFEELAESKKLSDDLIAYVTPFLVKS